MCGRSGISPLRRSAPHDMPGHWPQIHPNRWQEPGRYELLHQATRALPMCPNLGRTITIQNMARRRSWNVTGQADVPSEAAGEVLRVLAKQEERRREGFISHGAQSIHPHYAEAFLNPSTSKVPFPLHHPVQLLPDMLEDRCFSEDCRADEESHGGLPPVVVVIALQVGVAVADVNGTFCMAACCVARKLTGGLSIPCRCSLRLQHVCTGMVSV